MRDKGSINFSASQEVSEKQDEQSYPLDKLDLLLAKKVKLFQTSAIFPFQLNPDDLIIDTQKVTLIYNQILGPSSTETILIDQIGEVDIDISFLFGVLKILSLSHDKKWLEITHLPRNDAIKAKRIIEGLLIAKKEGVNFDENEDSKLVDKLEKLGSSL